MYQDTSGRAVSPVIAVILMVAVTVLLSVAVGTLVLNIGESPSDSAIKSGLGVDISRASDSVTINVQTGTADKLEVRVDGKLVENISNPSAGDSEIVPAMENESVSVVAVIDGSRTVISQSDSAPKSSGSNLVSATLTWSTSTDWDDGVSVGIAHDSTANTDNNNASSVKLGYPTSSLPSALVGYWTLDEDSGGVAYDLVNGNDGTLYGPSQGQSGILGETSYTFVDSNSEYVEIADGSAPSVFNLTSEVTVSAWVKSNPSSTRNTVFWHGYDKQSDSESIAYTLYTQGEDLRFRIANGVSSDIVSTDVNMNDSKWHHVAGVLTSSELQIYKDGKLVGTASRTITPQKGDRTLIGQRANWGGGWYFDGSITDVRLFNKALTSTEIEEEYSVGNSGSITTASESAGGSLVVKNVTLNGTIPTGTSAIVDVQTDSGSTLASATFTAGEGGKTKSVSVSDAYSQYQTQVTLNVTDVTKTPVVTDVTIEG